MKILHVAYSLSEQSAAYHLAVSQSMQPGYSVEFLLGRTSLSRFIESRRLNRNLTTYFGLFLHACDLFLRRSLINGNEVFSMGFRFRLWYWVVEKIIRQANPNILHIHWGGYGFFTEKLIGRLIKKTGLAVIVTNHDYNLLTGGCHVPMDCSEFFKGCFACPMAKNHFGKRWVKQQCSSKRMAENLAKVTFVSPSRYTKSVTDQVLPGIKSYLVPNTVGNLYQLGEPLLIDRYERYQRFRELNSGIPTLLVVGVSITNRHNKGADILERVFSELSKKNILFNLITVGQFIDFTVTANHIHFERLASDDLIQQYTIADMCLVPSRYETFSQVTLESIQSGTPVIAFNLTGPADIVQDARSGFLVAPFDVQRYCEVIIERLNFKFDNRQIVISEACEAAVRFSPQSISSAYHEVYKCSMAEKAIS